MTTKAIYRSLTAKRRTSRPKSTKRATAPYGGMLAKLQSASLALSAARGRR